MVEVGSGRVECDLASSVSPHLPLGYLNQETSEKKLKIIRKIFKILYVNCCSKIASLNLSIRYVITPCSNSKECSLSEPLLDNL